MWTFYFYKILFTIKLDTVIPANSLGNFALQTMFDLLITIANRQLSSITSMYALRSVDLKGHGGNRPVERRRTTPGRDPIRQRVLRW